MKTPSIGRDEGRIEVYPEYFNPERGVSCFMMELGSHDVLTGATSTAIFIAFQAIRRWGILCICYAGMEWMWSELRIRVYESTTIQESGVGLGGPGRYPGHDGQTSC